MRSPHSVRRAARGAALGTAAAVAGLILLGAFAHAAEPAAKDAKTILSSAPDFTATGLDGKTYKLSELLKQGPVLIDFWTTYCGPCKRELPELQKVWEKHKAGGFTLLGVACDDQRTVGKVKPSAQAMGLKFPIVTDSDKKIANAYNVRNHPTTVLVTTDGKIAKYTLGYNPGDERELEAKIAALLGGTRGGTH